MRTIAIALLLAACGSSASAPGDDTGDDTGGDDTGGDDTGGDDAPEIDAGPPVVRFIAMGDTGEGNQAQRDVAIAIRDLCAQEGCDFVLLLGDNIYDAGVDGVDDAQWQEKFEIPYMDVDLPFYAVLGNHDYGGEIIGIDVGGLGNEWPLAAHEVAYSDVSGKWRMPDTHYTIRQEHVGILALDTNSALWSNTDWGDQREWFPTALAELEGTTWTIAAGHHPYRSNGTHGNAGNYDAPEIGGIPIPNPLPIQNGEEMKTFYEEVVCGHIDMLLTGHDHSRQWLDEPEALCGAELIVSGAGAKTTEIIDRGNVAFFEDASEEGFLYVEIVGNTLRGQIYDAAGNLDFERVITKE
jgi:tartrate-resistant acid phosphatase type 5